jgi:hypothetical protein
VSYGVFKYGGFALVFGALIVKVYKYCILYTLSIINGFFFIDSPNQFDLQPSNIQYSQLFYRFCHVDVSPLIPYTVGSIIANMELGALVRAAVGYVKHALIFFKRNCALLYS